MFGHALAVTKALGEFNPFIRTCWNATALAGEGMKNYFGQFANRSEFITCFFQNTMSNMFVIQDIYNKFSAAQTAGNQTEEALQLGRLTRKLLGFGPCLGGSTPKVEEKLGANSS